MCNCCNHCYKINRSRQLKRKIIFVVVNLKLCHDIFDKDNYGTMLANQNAYKSKEARKLICMARQEIKYSCGTVDHDIYSIIRRVYRWLLENSIIK